MDRRILPLKHRIIFLKDFFFFHGIPPGTQTHYNGNILNIKLITEQNVLNEIILLKILVNFDTAFVLLLTYIYLTG